MRRGVGVGRVQRQRQERQKFDAVSETLASDKTQHIAQQLDLFKTNLEAFAQKHKKEINKNPEFRRQFQRMCAQIGVDPLASSKGFWAELLGFGDFYYELGVQVVDVCLSTRAENGGLIDVEELRARLERMRGSRAADISTDDIVRAVEKLKVLGNGFRVVSVGPRQMVISVPCELNQDHTAVLVEAQRSGRVTVSALGSKLGWTAERAQRALDVLLREGMAWVDDQDTERAFWLPSVLHCVGDAVASGAAAGAADAAAGTAAAGAGAIAVS